MGRKLVMVAIDFEKVFDSVERGALVGALKYYKCDPRLNEIIVDIYMGDRTERWTEDGGHRGDRGN